MNEINFDISGNNSDIIKKTNEIRSAINAISEVVNEQSFNIETAFNEISVKALEQIMTILQELPSEVKGLNYMSKEIDYLDKCLKQLIQNVSEMHGQVKQFTPLQGNLKRSMQEISASELLIKCMKNILVLREQNVASVYQEQSAISLYQKELENLENIESNGLKLSEAQQEKRILLIESLMRHKQAVETLNLTITNGIQIERVFIASINEMIQSLNHIQTVYGQLSEQEHNSKFGRELSISIRDADGLVRQLIETLDNTQGIMEAYTCQWSRLQQQIQLVARELPNAGNGFVTFFASIKENLPYLIEEFNKAKRAYSEYQTAINNGQTNIPQVASVGTQMIKSLLSWQTVIIVGVTLLAAYSKEIGEWIGGLFRARDASKSLLNAEQEMALARRSAIENSMKERVELDLLYRVATNVGKKDTDRYAAVFKLQSLYPQVFENYSKEEIMLGKAAIGYENLKKQIIATATAKAYENKITEVEGEKWKNEIKRLNQKKTLSEAFTKYANAQKKYDEYSSRLIGKSKATQIAMTSPRTDFGEKYAKAKSDYILAKNEYEKQGEIYDDLLKQTNDYNTIISHMFQQIDIQSLYPKPEEGTYDHWLQQLQSADFLLKQIKSDIKSILDEAVLNGKDLYGLGIDKSTVELYTQAVGQKGEARKALNVYEDTDQTKYSFPQEPQQNLINGTNQINENARSILDVDLQQERANLKEDSKDKKLSQIQSDYDKRYFEIQEREQRFLQNLQDEERNKWEKDNPDWEGKDLVFTPQIVSLPEEDAQKFQEMYSNAYSVAENSRKAYYDSENQAMNEHLKEYGTYEQKRKAIIALGEEKKKGKNEWEQKTIEKETQKSLSSLDIEAAENSKAFGQLFTNVKERSVKDMRSIVDEAQSALDFIKGGNWDAAKGTEFGITEESFNALKSSTEEIDKIKENIKGLNQQANASDTAFNKMGDGFKKLFNADSDPKKLKEALGEIEGAMNEVIQSVQFFSNCLSSLGDAFGSDTLSGIAEGMNVAMDAASSAMSGAQAGAALGPWGAAAGAAIGLVSSLGSSLAKLHDAKHEKSIQQIQEQIEVLEKSYENLGDSLDKAFSSDASELIDQQNTLLEQQKVLIRNQIAEEQSKKKSDQGRIDEWEKQIEDIDKVIAGNKEKKIDVIFGEDLKAAIENFAQAYAEAWSAGDDKAKSSKELVKNMIKQMITEAIKAASSKPMEALRQRLANFFSDGIISDWERQQIEKDAEAIANDLDRQFSWADEYMKGDEKESSSQDSTKGGFASMSQETGDELNGRFTALQISNEEIKNSMFFVMGNLSSLCTNTSNGNILLTEMRNLAVMSNGHLEDIAKYTKVLLGFGEKLDNIAYNTKSLTVK